jgi:hypothetical protein
MVIAKRQRHERQRDTNATVMVRYQQREVRCGAVRTQQQPQDESCGSGNLRTATSMAAPALSVSGSDTSSALTPLSSVIDMNERLSLGDDTTSASGVKPRGRDGSPNCTAQPAARRTHDHTHTHTRWRGDAVARARQRAVSRHGGGDPPSRQDTSSRCRGTYPQADCGAGDNDSDERHGPPRYRRFTARRSGNR